MKKTNSKEVLDQLRIDVLEDFADSASYESDQQGRTVPPIACLVKQIDSMKHQGESLYATCRRYYEGGSGLVYYDECRKYLKELLDETEAEAAAFNDNKVWETYLHLMARTMAKLYTEHKAWVDTMHA